MFSSKMVITIALLCTASCAPMRPPASPSGQQTQDLSSSQPSADQQPALDEQKPEADADAVAPR